MEQRIEELNRFTVGWTAYFALADTPTPLQRLDRWLRRRLRQVRWKEWKRPKTKRRNLRAANARRANGRTRARGTGASLTLQSSPAPCPTPTGPTSAWKGSQNPTAASGMPSEPPDADPHVRWCGGRRGEPGAYPIPTHDSGRASATLLVSDLNSEARSAEERALASRPERRHSREPCAVPIGNRNLA
jgi:Group II intron, maturase-specific domain